jgi:ABC-type siderophore export system fused ATPase/permease subunit
MRAAGATVVVLAHDPAPFAHADVFIDLNTKPVPAVRAGAPAPTAAAPGAEDTRHARP